MNTFTKVPTLSDIESRGMAVNWSMLETKERGTVKSSMIIRDSLREVEGHEIKEAIRFSTYWTKSGVCHGLVRFNTYNGFVDFYAKAGGWGYDKTSHVFSECLRLAGFERAIGSGEYDVYDTMIVATKALYNQSYVYMLQH